MSPESANHTVTKSYAASFTGLCAFGGVYVTEKRPTTLPSLYITLRVSRFYTGAGIAQWLERRTRD